MPSFEHVKFVLIYSYLANLTHLICSLWISHNIQHKGTSRVARPTTKYLQIMMKILGAHFTIIFEYSGVVPKHAFAPRTISLRMRESGDDGICKCIYCFAQFTYLFIQLIIDSMGAICSNHHTANSTHLRNDGLFDANADEN